MTLFMHRVINRTRLLIGATVVLLALLVSGALMLLAAL